ncbi:MAG: c-type cytochrome [Acidobacteriota bacterium]|nr:c-type cytochrome [Acidobacteriota bacterium]
MHRVLWGVVALAAATLAGGDLRPVAAQPAANQPAFYTERVQPIFVANCAHCHLGTAHRGGLSLASRASILKGGRDGAVLIPGDPANSMLIKLIRHQGPANDPMPMPPKSKLSDADIATVEQWIKAGAVMPKDPDTR